MVPSGRLDDTAHDYTVGEHVVIAIVPLTRRAADRRAL
jgi:hypothetical protein